MVKVQKSLSYCPVEDSLTLVDAWSDHLETITVSSFPMCLQTLTLH